MKKNYQKNLLLCVAFSSVMNCFFTAHATESLISSGIKVIHTGYEAIKSYTLKTMLLEKENHKRLLKNGRQITTRYQIIMSEYRYVLIEFKKKENPIVFLNEDMYKKFYPNKNSNNSMVVE